MINGEDCTQARTAMSADATGVAESHATPYMRPRVVSAAAARVWHRPDRMDRAAGALSRHCDARSAGRQLAYATLDGNLIPIKRVTNQRPYHSGERDRHGAGSPSTSAPARLPLTD